MGGVLPNIMGLQLAGRTAQSVLDEPLAEFPQGPGCLFTLSLLGWQATATVVEIHASKALQLWGDCTVDSGSSSLLLKSREERKAIIFKEMSDKTMPFGYLEISEPFSTWTSAWQRALLQAQDRKSMMCDSCEKTSL